MVAVDSAVFWGEVWICGWSSGMQLWLWSCCTTARGCLQSSTLTGGSNHAEHVRQVCGNKCPMRSVDRHPP